MTWWYPGYTVSVRHCGHWHRIEYYRPLPVYLTSFRFCDTPCEVVSECSLLSPAVVVAAWEPATLASPVVAAGSAVGLAVAGVSADESGGLPPPASAAELASTTERELADTYMRLGDADSAVRVYSAHLSRHPGDVMALRALGVALIERGETRSGVDSVERAYRIDPTLGARLFDRELLRTPENLGLVLDRATSLAHQLEQGPGATAAWLTVAVLMQADGRLEPARTSLERAREAGLDRRVAGPMQDALNGS